AIALSTFARVRSRTAGSSLITRDTVFSETDARFATSLMVGFCTRVPLSCALVAPAPDVSPRGLPRARSRGIAQPRPVAAQRVVEDVEVARHHQRREYHLEIVVHLQVCEQLRDHRASGDAHDQEGRTEFRE